MNVDTMELSQYVDVVFSHASLSNRMLQYWDYGLSADNPANSPIFNNTEHWDATMGGNGNYTPHNPTYSMGLVPAQQGGGPVLTGPFVK
jgi:hypothetical protein